MNKSIRPGWYVAYVKSRHEKKVDKLLQDACIESYLPLIKTEKKWSDRKKVVFEPLFSSYVFVNIKERAEFSKALMMDGICDFIRFGKEFAQVKDEEIEDIKMLLGGGYKDIEAKRSLPRVGELRTIRFGLLSGRKCQIMKVNNVSKILVRVDSIHMAIMATLPAGYLEEAGAY